MKLQLNVGLRKSPYRPGTYEVYARRASLELGLFSPAPIHDDFEKLKLADSLGFMGELLGAGDALVKQILNGKSPEVRANELIEGTRLKDPAFRRELAAGGSKAIESSNDPMIVLARMIDPKARELRRRYENEVTGVERASYSKIARARFDTEGTKLYPDATFTLRLSYGAVKGYMENGKKVAPFTTLGGLYDRSTQFKAEFPYNLPSRWLDKKSTVDLKTPFNFVSTNDIASSRLRSTPSSCASSTACSAVRNRGPGFHPCSMRSRPVMRGAGRISSSGVLDSFSRTNS